MARGREESPSDDIMPISTRSSSGSVASSASEVEESGGGGGGGGGVRGSVDEGKVGGEEEVGFGFEQRLRTMTGISLEDRLAASTARKRAMTEVPGLGRGGRRVEEEEKEGKGEEGKEGEEGKGTPVEAEAGSPLLEGVKTGSLFDQPAFQFIIMKDLYSFLNTSGVSVCCVFEALLRRVHVRVQDAGERFFANRALMELVQRIRADHKLFEKSFDHPSCGVACNLASVCV